jgi:hypothetical protein
LKVSSPFLSIRAVEVLFRLFILKPFDINASVCSIKAAFVKKLLALHTHEEDGIADFPTMRDAECFGGILEYTPESAL